MEKIKNSKGITLIVLVITIVILMIIAGITVNSGKESIQQAKLESLRTNMLLISAKAKECVEEATFKKGLDNNTTAKEEVYANNFLIKETDTSLINKVGATGECYRVTTSQDNQENNTLKLWGLEKIESEMSEGEYYLIQFNEDENTAEVYNTMGFDGKYSLTDIENLEI